MDHSIHELLKAALALADPVAENIIIAARYEAEAARLAALPPTTHVSAIDFAPDDRPGAWRTAKTAAQQHRDMAQYYRSL